MHSRLAIHGGKPVRQTMLPYGAQWVGEDDISAVIEVLHGKWLTTGPTVELFEHTFADLVGTREVVAVANGTAAFHAAIYAIGIKAGDEVIVPAMTFAATANCVVFQGGTPVFADVNPHSLLIAPAQAEARITHRTRAIIAVDYAGHPCDYGALRTVASSHGLVLMADACHALGGSYKGRPVGSLADLSTFSLHPVKPITTGEGGVIATDNRELAQRMRAFRNHGITSDHRQRERLGSWFYEMVDLGYNYRLTDFQCALGMSQLRKLAGWVSRRQEIAHTYDAAFAELPGVKPLRVSSAVSHAYHLYVIRIDQGIVGMTRAQAFAALRAEGIGANVHYIPVHLHPYYLQHFGTGPGLCPVSEKAYEEILSLPIFPAMTDQDVADVIAAVRKVTEAT